MLIEPVLASSGSLGIYLSDQIRGGAVAFGREDVDEEAVLAELRRTVSDDALLNEHLRVSRGRDGPFGWPTWPGRDGRGSL